MNALIAPSATETTLSLAGIVDRAATALSLAKSAAEVLDARDLASVAYDLAKKTARLAKAKHAHDDVISAALRAQADALEIQSEAKRRLADEYDAAQERGEVATRSDGASIRYHVPGENKITTAADIGLTRKEIHEARIIRDAEKAEPGIVRRALDQALADGVEPTKARVKRAVSKMNKQPDKPQNVVPLRRRAPTVEQSSQHDRDLQMIIGVWQATCPSAQIAFDEWRAGQSKLREGN